ncbi:MAG: PQQ-dependent sugar dehydrogenase [Acidimicrobiia bacterium]
MQLPSVARSLLVVTAVLVIAAPVAAGPLPPGGTFLDDDGNTHEGSIEAIAAAGITLGCNPPANDRYCPSGTVSRGAMAAFLVRALGLTDNGGGNLFTDDNESIFEGEIDRLGAAGITKGCDPPANTRFCPDDPVTREQMAAFLVRAFGYTDPGAGNWFTDDDTSVFEADIDRLRVAGVTLGCNPPTNDNFCPRDPVLRDQMASFLTRALGLTPMVPPPRPEAVLETVAFGLFEPTFLTAPPGDDRLFITEKGGTVRIVDGGTLLTDPFLDVRSATSTGGEAGLLSLAFHPDYATNGRFYVYQNGPPSNTSYIYEYTVSADPNDADESSRRTILSLSQGASNHNGGQIEFGPDGMLWIGFGDEGGQDDGFGNGQNLGTWHGAMLRIDVDSGSPYAVPADNPFVGAAGLDEIWAYGLRNPWRWAFYGGDLYIADVGQGAREEIDIVSLATGAGSNFGWCDWEGTLSHAGFPNCPGTASGVTFPVVELTHSAGNCSITGGRVYEGTALSHLVGHYFYADLCRGHLMSFEWSGGTVTNSRDWTADLGTIGGIWSFGSDSDGELYIVLGSSGEVLRLAAG